MWDSVVDVVICLNRPKASFHDICRCSKWSTISINLLGQNYQHLTTSAYVLLCWCVSENQPLVITVVNHLDTAYTSLLYMCKQCQDETIRTIRRHSSAKSRDCYYTMSQKDQELNKMIVKNTIASICHKNMLAYLSADIICSDKETVFQEL